MTLLLIYLITFGALIFHLFKKGKWAFLAGLNKWILFLYGSVFVLYATGLIDYREDLSHAATLYLIGAIACFALFHIIGLKLPSRSLKSVSLKPKTLDFFIRIMGAMGLLGASASLLYFFQSGMAFMDFDQARAVVIDGNYVPPLAYRYLMGYAAPLGLVAACLAILSPIRLTTVTKLMAYGGALAGPINAFTIFGRMNVLQTLFVVAIAFLLAKSIGMAIRLSKFERAGIILMCLVGAAYLFILPLFRLNAEDKAENLLTSYNATPSHELQTILDTLPRGLGTTFVNTLGYFSHQPIMFTRFWELMSIGPYYGHYQFHEVATRVTGQFLLLDIRAQILEQSEDFGLFGNVWATLIRDIMIDFGKVGTYIQMGLFGLISGITKNRFILYRSLGDGVLFCCLAGWILFGICIAATFVQFYQIFFYYCVLIWVFGGFSITVSHAENATIPVRQEGANDAIREN